MGSLYTFVHCHSVHLAVKRPHIPVPLRPLIRCKSAMQGFFVTLYLHIELISIKLIPIKLIAINLLSGLHHLYSLSSCHMPQSGSVQDVMVESRAVSNAAYFSDL